jgi:cytochrome P450
VDTVSYYVIVATAGHDTTSATISGGLHALIENPDQLQRLQDNPELMPLATEEMIRWVTPVKEFMRTAAEDTEVRGIPIAAGESVLLSYPSANRDEEIFDEPFRFDVGRNPNKRGTGPDGGEQFLLRVGAAAGLDRAHRRPGIHRDHLRRRPEAPADPLLAAVITYF